MTAAALVSIVMPVHNGAQYLREAIESALTQDYAPLEVVVVDDGSTDETPALLDGFGARIVRIRQPNSGAAVARNTAIAACRGEFIAFLDADDLWLPHKLRTQMEYLQQHPEVDLVSSHWTVQVAEQPVAGIGHSVQSATSMRDTPEPSAWIYNELLMDCIVHTTTVVMRRRLVERIGLFDVTLRRGQDYDYWLRASRVTPIHRLPQALSVYRLHESNSTWRPQPVNYAATILERALRLWGRKGPDGRVTPLHIMRRRLSELWFSFGYQHASNGSRAVAVNAALRSLRAWPLYSKPWRLLARCALAAVRGAT
jgi:glycosyltransferase involved in cell wall biosynthesis